MSCSKKLLEAPTTYQKLLAPHAAWNQFLTANGSSLFDLVVKRNTKCSLVLFLKKQLLKEYLLKH